MIDKNEYRLRLVWVVPLVMGVLSSLQAHGASLTLGEERQSPIDIITANVVTADLPPLEFTYATGVPLTVVNTGSPGVFATVRSNVPLNAGTLLIGSVLYDLLQFHWHISGEHEVDGAEFPMEMHLVHQRAGATGNDGLLAVGVGMGRRAEHIELNKIFSDLPQMPGETRAIPSFNLTALLPDNLASFRYQGSLTTPPFTDLEWVVFQNSLQLSAGQIDAFMALFEDGNAREVQPIGDRLVQTEVPEPATIFLVAVGLLVFCAWRRRRIGRPHGDW